MLDRRENPCYAYAMFIALATTVMFIALIVIAAVRHVDSLMR